MLNLKNKQNIEASPCVTCPKWNRYSIGKTNNGKIIRYNCADECQSIKEWAKNIVKEIFNDSK